MALSLVTMDALANRWVLRDFGTLQFLWDSFSGLYFKVFGPGAVSEGGPWRLEADEGRPELVSLEEGGDGACTLFPECLSRLKVVVDETSGEVLVESRSETDQENFESLDVWRDLRKDTVVSQALEVPVEGQPAFKSVFYWETVPTYCGDKPVSLWLSFSWLLDYVLGKDAPTFVWRYAATHEKYLLSLGLDESHVANSARSRDRKRRRVGEADASESESAMSSEWRLSVQAAILFLEEVACSKRLGTRSKDKDVAKSKARALLTAFLQWPRHGEEIIAFALPGSGCQMLLRGMQVDREILVESEEFCSARDLKIASLCTGDKPDVLELLDARRQKLRWKSRWPAEHVKKLNVWLVEVAEVFGELWESTRDLPVWDEQDHLDLGVLTTPGGQCRRIPASYKAALITEARSSEEVGIKKLSSLVQGLGRAATARRLRVSFVSRGAMSHSEKRQKAKRQRRLAKSQSSSGHPDARTFSPKLQKWDRWNYHLLCRKEARGELTLSLAMDATDVSKAKRMNATVHLPQKVRSLWLPPMDSGVSLSMEQ